MELTGWAHQGLPDPGAQLGRRERGQSVRPPVARRTGRRSAGSARTARGFPGKGLIVGDDDGHGEPPSPAGGAGAQAPESSNTCSSETRPHGSVNHDGVRPRTGGTMAP